MPQTNGNSNSNSNNEQNKIKPRGATEEEKREKAAKMFSLMKQAEKSTLPKQQYSDKDKVLNPGHARTFLYPHECWRFGLIGWLIFSIVWFALYIIAPTLIRANVDGTLGFDWFSRVTQIQATHPNN